MMMDLIVGRLMKFVCEGRRSHPEEAPLHQLLHSAARNGAQGPGTVSQCHVCTVGPTAYQGF